MSLSDEQLKQLIQEEVDTLEEGWLDRMRARFAGAGQAVGQIPKAIGQAGSALMGRGAEARRPGAYHRGKAEKIVKIAASKLGKLFDRFMTKLEGEIDEMTKDLEKLGIEPSVAEMAAGSIVRQRISEFLEDVSAEFGAVFEGPDTAFTPEAEAPVTAQAPAARPEAGLGAATSMTNRELRKQGQPEYSGGFAEHKKFPEMNLLKEHFKRFL